MDDLMWALVPAGRDIHRLATKTLTFADGVWRKDAGADITEWEAWAQPAPQTLDELFACLEPLMRPGANAVWIRGEPTRPLPDGTRCNRRMKPDRFGRAPDWRDHPDGRRVICIDVDGGTESTGAVKWPAPEWLSDAPDAAELARLADCARKRLPEPFRDAGAVYRYSSGMGTTGGWREIRLHLWFLADRAVPDAELRRYFTAHNALNPTHKVDTQLYTANQIHYLAPPVCVGAPDPIGAGRYGVLDGAPVVLPAGLRSGAELAAEVERKKVERKKRTEVARERFAEYGGTLPPGVATEALERALERLERAPAGQRNSAMYSEVMRVWPYVNAGALDEQLATARFAELYSAINPDDAAKLLDVIARARREALPVDIGDALELVPPVVDTTQHEPATHEDIGELRAWLADEMRAAVERGGVTAFAVTPGGGKSYAALSAAVDVIRDDGHVLYYAQTRALRDALASKLRELGNYLIPSVVGIREARTPDNCPMHETYYALDKRRPGGGSPFCGACPHNPSQRGNVCDFWRARLRRQEQRVFESATFATHAFAILGAAPAAVDIGDAEVRVAWHYWRDAVSAGARVRPVLHRTSAQVVIVPVLALDGEGVELCSSDFVPSNDGDEWPAENRATLLLTLARLLDCSQDTDAIVAKLVEQGAWHLPELAIIDESIMGELAAPVSADASELGSMASELAPGPARDRLIALVAEGGHRSADDLVRELGDGLVLTVAPGEYRPSGHEQTMRHWRFVDALRTAVNNGWRGAYVRDGRLHLTYFAPVDWSRLARAVIVLDGDASEGNVRAMFGAEYRRATLPLTHVHATRVDISTGKGKGKSAPPPRVLRALRATLQRFGHERSVLFTHKSWVPELDDLRGAHGAVDYFGSPSSRGSNTYEGCDLIACEFHVSSDVVDARAYAYATMAGDDWSATCDFWRGVARDDLERAVFTQAVHRARPALATAERPVRIVVLDRRPLGVVWPEFGGTETVLCPDRLVAEVDGHVYGRGGHLAMLDARVRACGGVFAPALMPSKMTLTRIESSLVQGHGDFSHIDTATFTPTLTQAFVYAAKTHFGGDVAAFADAAGFHLTFVPNSTGGEKGVAFVHTGELTAEVVRTYLAGVDGYGWRWFELGGERYSTAVGDAERAALEHALAELPGGLSAREQDALLGELLGVSSSTVKRRLRRYGLTRPSSAVERGTDTTQLEFVTTSHEHWDSLPDEIARVLRHVGAQVSPPVADVARGLLMRDVTRYNAAVEHERVERLLEHYSAFAGAVLDGSTRQRSCDAMLSTPDALSRWVARLPVPVPTRSWRAYAPDVDIRDEYAAWLADCDWRIRRNAALSWYVEPPELSPMLTFAEWQSAQPIGMASALSARCYSRPGAPATSGELLDA